MDVAGRGAESAAPAPADVGDDAPSSKPTGLLRSVCLVGAIGLVAAGLVFGALRSPWLDSRSSSNSTTANAAMFVAPGGVLDLSSVSADLALHYRFAKSHRAEFSEVPCWCGCAKTLQHRNLFDCFERPDGRWEAHAAGCGVCIAEATIVRDSLAANIPLNSIVTNINGRFGPPTTTTNA